MFRVRSDAGRQLAQALKPLDINDAVALALPRGGIILANEISQEFNIPLGLILVRKISHPFFPEYAIGALVDHGKPIYSTENKNTIDSFWLSKTELNAQKLNSYRRELYFNGEFTEPELRGKTVVIIDDGIATGLSMKASVLAVRASQPKRVIVAVPVASNASLMELQGLADEVIIIYDPARFKGSVGAHYLKFGQVDDEKVRQILRSKTYELPPAMAFS